MVKSMTGFGRCEVSEGDRKMTVEMKSVNHRYLDVNIKMPKKLNFFESAVRSLLKTYLQRGKVDLFITYEDLSETKGVLRYNRELAAEYLNYLKQMSEEFCLESAIDAAALSRYPEVLVMEETRDDEEELWKLLKEALEGACRQMVETRWKGRTLSAISQPSLTRCWSMWPLSRSALPRLWRNTAAGLRKR